VVRRPPRSVFVVFVVFVVFLIISSPPPPPLPEERSLPLPSAGLEERAWMCS